ncbi:MAG: YbjN domain-containing protein [Alphaproteobacteria bacterium]
MQNQAQKTSAKAKIGPVEVMETLFRSHQWSFERTLNDGLTLQTKGNWCNYALHCAVEPQNDLFYMTCTYDMRVPHHQRSALDALLSQINREMWMGHFDLCSQDGSPTYRHALPIRGVKAFSLEQMEDMVDHALSECERFYPAFQACLWGKIKPDVAIASALMECHGYA